MNEKQMYVLVSFVNSSILFAKYICTLYIFDDKVRIPKQTRKW